METNDDYELQIDIVDLQKRKLMIATPMYGGQCYGNYTNSLNQLNILFSNYQLHLNQQFIYNESLITRARNYLVDEFMRSDCTHLMFIDADIGFDPNDIVALLAIADPTSDKDIVCGPYPKKCISWEKVKRAVDKGFGDNDPEQLAHYIGDYVFNPVGDNPWVALHKPVEVLEGGTGFMMIQRHVIEDMIKAYPHLAYLPDHVRSDHFDGSREIYALFDALIDDKNSNINNELTEYLKKNPNASHTDILAFVNNKTSSILGLQYSNRYLSEDYMFCQWARRIGKKVWLCPWMKLQHIGTYVFAGSLADLAQVGVAATADAAALGKKDKLDKSKKRDYTQV